MLPCVLVHDFFQSQPVKNADVFLLRNILHDWSDKYCLQILRKLRDAAATHTKLVVVDNLLSYACRNDEISTIPGAESSILPSPLLPNGGAANIAAYCGDINMMALCNGMERTAMQVQQLLRQTGWKLVHVVEGAGVSGAKAIATPA
jgi:hypothetical protein